MVGQAQATEAGACAVFIAAGPYWPFCSPRRGRPHRVLVARIRSSSIQ